MTHAQCLCVPVEQWQTILDPDYNLWLSSFELSPFTGAWPFALSSIVQVTSPSHVNSVEDLLERIESAFCSFSTLYLNRQSEFQFNFVDLHALVLVRVVSRTDCFPQHTSSTPLSVHGTHFRVSVLQLEHADDTAPRLRVHEYVPSSSAFHCISSSIAGGTDRSSAFGLLLCAFYRLYGERNASFICANDAELYETTIYLCSIYNARSSVGIARLLQICMFEDSYASFCRSALAAVYYANENSDIEVAAQKISQSAVEIADNATLVGLSLDVGSITVLLVLLSHSLYKRGAATLLRRDGTSEQRDAQFRDADAIVGTFVDNLFTPTSSPELLWSNENGIVDI